MPRKDTPHIAVLGARPCRPGGGACTPAASACRSPFTNAAALPNTGSAGATCACSAPSA